MAVLLLYLCYIRPFANHFREQQLYKLLVSTTYILQKCNVTHILDQGTLLGGHRDGKIITGDTDVDILLIGWDQRLKLLKCERDFKYFEKAGLNFVDDRNKNGGIAVRDKYQFYVDVDTTSLLPTQHGEILTLRDTTLPHCQPDIIHTGSHRSACDHPLEMVVDVCSSCVSMHWPAGCQTEEIVALLGPCASGSLHGIYKFSAPNQTEAYLATKYPNWKTPRSMDKGTDTTPGDIFKAHFHLAVEFFQVVLIMSRWMGVYVARLVIFGGCCAMWSAFLFVHWLRRNICPKVHVSIA